MAYMPQQAFVLNNTLRENILFGQAYNKERYSKVIAACALQPDLDILPAEDQTEIGERVSCFRNFLWLFGYWACKTAAH